MEEKDYTFWDHLDDLRKIVIRILVVWLLLAVLLFLKMDYIFEHIILAPCSSDFVFYQWLRELFSSSSEPGALFSSFNDIELINIHLAAPFLIHISTSFYLSIVFVLPYMMFEVWRFVSLGLYESEIKSIRKVFFGSALIFYLGCLFGYYVIFPLTLRFLSSYTLSVSIANQISLNSYMSNFMTLILSMGIATQLPLLIYILSIVGVLNKTILKKNRKYAILVMTVLAAVITPTGDPFTLSIVAIPLYLLYELAILMVKKEPSSSIG